MRIHDQSRERKSQSRRGDRVIGGNSVLAIAALIFCSSHSLLGDDVQVLSKPGQTAATQPSREAALWQEIVARHTPPASQPAQGWFAIAIDQRLALLKQVQLYQLMYPGGEHRDEVVILELATRFELATIQGNFEPFCQRVRDYLVRPPSEVAQAEAAFWDMTCRRLEKTTHQESVTTRPAIASDAAQLVAYRDYVTNFPRSRHTPRLTDLLVNDAIHRGDLEYARSRTAQLAGDFPDHSITQALVAQLRRLDAVGKPFVEQFQTIDGRPFPLPAAGMQAAIIVFWTGAEPAAVSAVREIAGWQKQNGNIAVLGVSLDDSPEQTLANAAGLGLAWPQCNDGLGWGGSLVRGWGIRRLPAVFVVDSQGNLVQTLVGDEWTGVQAINLPP